MLKLPPMVKTPIPVKRKKKAVVINASEDRDTNEMFEALKKNKIPKIIVINDK